MPNIGAHLRITAEYTHSRSPDILLGSVVSDFDSMFRDYYGNPAVIGASRPEFEATKHLNAQTDVVHDALPIRKDCVRWLLDRVEPHNGKLVARQAAYSWSDLAFDGLHFMEDELTGELFKQVGEQVLAGTTGLEQYRPDRAYIAYVKGYFAEGIPLRYRAGDFLANSLVSRLRHRRRPILDTDFDIDNLSETFNDFFKEFDGMGVSKALLDGTVDNLRKYHDR
jgi:hypothetical protein